jgi:hypothetical protein
MYYKFRADVQNVDTMKLGFEAIYSHSIDKIKEVFNRKLNKKEFYSAFIIIRLADNYAKGTYEKNEYYFNDDNVVLIKERFSKKWKIQTTDEKDLLEDSNYIIKNLAFNYWYIYHQLMREVRVLFDSREKVFDYAKQYEIENKKTISKTNKSDFYEKGFHIDEIYGYCGSNFNALDADNLNIWQKRKIAREIQDKQLDNLAPMSYFDA